MLSILDIMLFPLFLANLPSSSPTIPEIALTGAISAWPGTKRINLSLRASESETGTFVFYARKTHQHSLKNIVFFNNTCVVHFVCFNKDGNLKGKSNIRFFSLSLVNNILSMNYEPLTSQVLPGQRRLDTVHIFRQKSLQLNSRKITSEYFVGEFHTYE